MWLLIFALTTFPLLMSQQVQIGGEPANPEKERARAVERAKSLIREKLKLPESQEIAVGSAKPAKWGDASLGCPEKGRMYAQVVTSGWAVVLEVHGLKHEVHVAGHRAVECPAKDAPDAVRK